MAVIQQTRVYPYPLGAGSARPNPKMGAPDPENPLFLGFSVLRGGLRPWSQTMVSEGAGPWGRGRSGDCQSWFFRPRKSGVLGGAKKFMVQNFMCFSAPIHLASYLPTCSKIDSKVTTKFGPAVPISQALLNSALLSSAFLSGLLHNTQRKGAKTLDIVGPLTLSTLKTLSALIKEIHAFLLN